MGVLVAEPAVVAAQIREPVVVPGSSIAGVDEIVFEDESLTVLVVHSAPDVRQPPHDHLISAVIGVYEGIEEPRYFRRNGGSLVRSGGADIGPGDVLTLGPAAIHAISATGSWCRAVHVYLGALDSVDRSLFDPDTYDDEPMTVERYAGFCRQDRRRRVPEPRRGHHLPLVDGACSQTLFTPVGRRVMWARPQSQSAASTGMRVMP